MTMIMRMMKRITTWKKKLAAKDNPDNPNQIIELKDLSMQTLRIDHLKKIKIKTITNQKKYLNLVRNKIMEKRKILTMEAMTMAKNQVMNIMMKNWMKMMKISKKLRFM